jgi:hypothetical protein
MTNIEIEKRIESLENEVVLLKADKSEKKKLLWEEIAGTFADDPVYDEAMRLGREYRLSQREDYDKDDE